MYNKPTKFDENRSSIFEEIKIVNFFLCELPLILRVDRKRKNELKIFARGPQISNVNGIVQLVSALRQATNRKLKNIFLVSGIFPGIADSVILFGFECTINPENLITIVGAIFEKMKILNLFICELPLILRVDRKRKKPTRDICKGTLDIEFQRDWSVGQVLFQLIARKLKTIFLVSGIFPGKADSVILLGFECTINPNGSRYLHKDPTYRI